MVSLKSHAARLRLFKNCAGMLYHPDADLVFNDHLHGFKSKIANVVGIIAGTTGLNSHDLKNYVGASVGKIIVNKGIDGIHRFSYKKDA